MPHGRHVAHPLHPLQKGRGRLDNTARMHIIEFMRELKQPADKSPALPVFFVWLAACAWFGAQSGCSAAGTQITPEPRDGMSAAAAEPEAPAPEAVEAGPAPIVESELNWPDIHSLDGLKEGATLPTGWGLKSEIPNDAFHSWSFKSPADWPDSEREALLRVTQQLDTETSWTITFDETTLPSTDVQVALDEHPASADCVNGTGTCWFGQTGCLQNEAQLEGYRVCSRWYMHLSMANIRARALRKNEPVETSLQVIFRHELGHSLGFAHGDGVMSTMLTTEHLRQQVSVEYTPCQKSRLSAYTRFIGVDAQVTMVTPAACER